MYARLEDVLGKDHADELMSALPPIEAAQLATKDDLAALRADLKSDIARLERRFDRLEDRLDAMQRTFVTALVGGMTGLTAIFSLIVVLWT